MQRTPTQDTGCCMLPGMDARLALALSPTGAWSLPRARAAASIVLDDSAYATGLLSGLMQTLFSPDAKLRRQAADVARRITEKQPSLLQPYAERVLDALVLAQDTQGDWRMLAHTGLVAAQAACTRAQRLRAAGLLRLLLVHPSNVVRCTALEGLGVIAFFEPSLRNEVKAILEHALVDGAPATRSRARTALARLR